MNSEHVPDEGIFGMSDGEDKLVVGLNPSGLPVLLVNQDMQSLLQISFPVQISTGNILNQNSGFKSWYRSGAQCFTRSGFNLQTPKCSYTSLQKSFSKDNIWFSSMVPGIAAVNSQKRLQLKFFWLD